MPGADILVGSVLRTTDLKRQELMFGLVQYLQLQWSRSCPRLHSEWRRSSWRWRAGSLRWFPGWGRRTTSRQAQAAVDKGTRQTSTQVTWLLQTHSPAGWCDMGCIPLPLCALTLNPQKLNYHEFFFVIGWFMHVTSLRVQGLEGRGHVGMDPLNWSFRADYVPTWTEHQIIYAYFL